MKNLSSAALKTEANRIYILNQKVLPHKEEWVECATIDDMYNCILELKVRGAPLIGVAAALSLAQYAQQGCSLEDFKKAAHKLRSARPTAVNLMAAVDLFLPLEKMDVEKINLMAEKFFNDDVELCEKISTAGATLINDGDRILTHCNAGALATAGLGTAIGVITKAWQQNKKIHVYVDETRPLLQGGRLTAWEMKRLGIPYTLICDNMAASLMKQKKVDKAIVGADRIALNGDFANKIGTYSVALACHYHKLDFYVAAPRTTVDPQCLHGDQIEIEERSAAEVLGVAVGSQEVSWSPSGTKVWNPAFDVTPHALVTKWILDSGVYSPEDVRSGKLRPS